MLLPAIWLHKKPRPGRGETVLGALACETASETGSHTPGNDGLSGLPRYPVERSRLSQGLHRMLPSARRVGYPALVLLAAGIDIDSGKPHPWRANGSPMCADSHAANMPAGPLTSHLSRTNQSHNLGLSGARDGEGATDRQFRASVISSLSRDFASSVEASFPVPERGHVSCCLTWGLGAAWWMEGIP